MYEIVAPVLFRLWGAQDPRLALVWWRPDTTLVSRLQSRQSSEGGQETGCGGSARPVHVGDTVLGNVHSFEYLGAKLQCDVSDEADVRQRMAIAQTTFVSLSNIWADHRLSRALKPITYQLAVCSTLTHSSEAWTLTAAVMRSINGFNSRCLHVITGQDYRHTATAPVFDLLRAIRQRRLRYLGHIIIIIIMAGMAHAWEQDGTPCSDDPDWVRHPLSRGHPSDGLSVNSIREHWGACAAERCLEHYGKPTAIAELCQANNLILTNTLFCHHRRNRYTWISPDNNTRNQIDYIAVNKQWASSILDAKSRPGADCYTDHILTSAKLRMKAFRNKGNKLPLRFDVDRFRDDEDLRHKYAVDTENRFQILCEAITEETAPNELWTSMEDSYKDSAKEIVGFVKKKRRKCWIKEDTLQLVDERRQARAVSNTNRRRELEKQVQQQLRRDKREWLNKQCQEIDEFDRLRKAKQFYKQVNSLKTNTFKARQSSINDRNGKTLTEPEHVLERWKEYGHDLFAKPDNEIPVTKAPLTKTEPAPLLSEVEAAVKQMKLGKAAGLDGVPGELIRNAGPSSMRAQHTLCTKIWESGEWPEIWKSQEFVVIYKTGNSKECSNYRL